MQTFAEFNISITDYINRERRLRYLKSPKSMTYQTKPT
jgi:hypothetical protein